MDKYNIYSRAPTPKAPRMKEEGGKSRGDLGLGRNFCPSLTSNVDPSDVRGYRRGVLEIWAGRCRP